MCGQQPTPRSLLIPAARCARRRRLLLQRSRCHPTLDPVERTRLSPKASNRCPRLNPVSGVVNGSIESNQAVVSSNYPPPYRSLARSGRGRSWCDPGAPARPAVVRSPTPPFVLQALAAGRSQRHAGISRGGLLLPRRAIVRTPGLTTGGIAGARRALPRGALELKPGAGVHHRRTSGVDGRDDLL